jgi:hypothetical protein
MSKERRQKQAARLKCESAAKEGRKPWWKRVGVIIGALVGVIGMTIGLIELRPQFAVTTVNPPFEPQPYLIPLKITNTGYLSEEISLTGYLEDYKTDSMSLGKMLIIKKAGAWHGGVLGRGESQSIVLELLKGFGEPEYADMALVVDYKTFGFPSRDVFRFQGVYSKKNASGGWYWLAEPSSGIRKNVDDTMRRFPL